MTCGDGNVVYPVPDFVNGIHSRLWQSLNVVLSPLKKTELVFPLTARRKEVMNRHAWWDNKTLLLPNVETLTTSVHWDVKVGVFEAISLSSSVCQFVVARVTGVPDSYFLRALQQNLIRVFSNFDRRKFVFFPPPVSSEEASRSPGAFRLTLGFSLDEEFSPLLDKSNLLSEQPLWIIQLVPLLRVKFQPDDPQDHLYTLKGAFVPPSCHLLSKSVFHTSCPLDQYLNLLLCLHAFWSYRKIEDFDFTGWALVFHHIFVVDQFKNLSLPDIFAILSQPSPVPLSFSDQQPFVASAFPHPLFELLACFYAHATSSQKNELFVRQRQLLQGVFCHPLTRISFSQKSESFMDFVKFLTSTSSPSISRDQIVTLSNHQPDPPASTPLDKKPQVQREEVHTCVVCTDLEPSFLILPCNHLCLCATCLPTYRSKYTFCPCCKGPLENIIGPVFLP